jgi:hypothetical protein
MKCGPWLAIALTLMVSGYASAQTLGRGRAPANLYGYQPPPLGPPVEVAPPQPLPQAYAPPATRVRRTTPDLPAFTPSPGVDYIDGYHLGAYGHGPYWNHGGIWPRLHTPWGIGYCRSGHGPCGVSNCGVNNCGPHVPAPYSPAPCATKPPKKVRRAKHVSHTPHCCVAPAPSHCDKKARAPRPRKSKHHCKENCSPCYAGHRSWLPWAGWNGYGWWGGCPCGVPHPHGHDPLKPAVPPPVGHGPVVEPAPSATTEPQASYRPPYSAERPTPAVVPSAAWNLEPARKSF